MKKLQLISGLAIALTLLSCKTADSSRLKDSESGNLNDQYLQLFQSVEVVPAQAKFKNANLYLAKTKKDGKITTVLYSTNGHSLGFADAKTVLDLADFNDSLDWDAWRKGSNQKGKIFFIQSQGAREVCLKDSSNQCEISQNEKAIAFKMGNVEKSLPILASFERVSVETKIVQTDVVDISYHFKSKDISLNQSETDSSEISIGVKCKGSTYSFDYFSGQAPNLKTVSIDELSKQLQPSIWSETGDNLFDESKKEKFRISTLEDVIHLQLRGELATDLISKCGQKIRNADIIVNGDLIKKS